VNEKIKELLDRLAAALSRLKPDRVDAFGDYLDGEAKAEGTADDDGDDSGDDQSTEPDGLPRESGDRNPPSRRPEVP
jgi:hypothetical protein